MADGDPFADFGSLVRTESVLRGGVPFRQAELVAAFADTPVARDAGDQDAWAEVGHLMRRESCCDPGR
ncbi:hypothetical protein [Streptomyces specialis]|uniref:hypothetical protein n=1 Tax=Streptomyces specialis TaxID=498367 RepID=UPI00073F8477|nr:hypothetical protein [Streptomyces specialis]